jgi:flagellar transcriptional activator FlhC
VRAFRLYQEQVQICGQDTVLALTRAWTLMRFFENDLLQLKGCTRCGGQFIVHAYAPAQDYVCGICHPPSRAGKTMRHAAAVAALRAN